MGLADELLTRLRDALFATSSVSASGTPALRSAQYVKGTVDGDTALLSVAASGDGLGVLAGARKGSTMTLFNALAITDTLDHTAAAVSISHITGKKTIEIVHTFNQPITKVRMSLGNGLGSGWTLVNDACTITAASGAKISSAAAAVGAQELTFVVPMLDLPWTSISLLLACAVAPTSGNVTVKLQGEM